MAHWTSFGSAGFRDTTSGLNILRGSCRANPPNYGEPFEQRDLGAWEGKGGAQSDIPRLEGFLNHENTYTILLTRGECMGSV